ncbi:Sodium/hydrogen exchanger family-domain-containing protein [Dunaliella salina]|uniref:Sodium/hydrogen exchanger family-domain-containing protein n=1 Tax=Dunaliella salina TaxID=3046 RepID=A0ABQ7G123_DUNSA|nr:Sodium/hydrogen exchanger family-domain-containing protein [Dunaliella salina]|eukprot:KAF5828304.1 Sodium/hydrogen exchanger family-domain-containing protein [Dunaliella salina]
MEHLRCFALLASLLSILCRGDGTDDSAEGPVVIQQHHPQQVQHRPPPSAGGSEDVGHQFGELLEAALKSEFGNGTQRLTNGTYSTFLNSTNHENEEGKMETVLRISAKRDAERLNEGLSGDYGQQGNGGQHKGHRHPGQGGDGKGGPQRLDINPGEGKANREASLETTHEGDVDRIVTHDNAVFVLSKPSESLASLTIDSQLLSDVTCLITASAVFGALAEAVHMPTMNGVLVAGAVAGPGGLQLVQELVQVETLAQLGALLLLFGLGMELSLAKLRSVWNVAVLGGALQIIISMALGMFMASSMFDAPPQTGAFVGGLLSMSSTSIVVKCLESLRSTGTMFGQITVGTLITQDVFVGIFFAVGPLFAKSSVQEPGSEDAAEQKGIAVLLVIKVFMKLGSTILLCSLFSTTMLRPLLRMLRR